MCFLAHASKSTLAKYLILWFNKRLRVLYRPGGGGFWQEAWMRLVVCGGGMCGGVSQLACVVCVVWMEIYRDVQSVYRVLLALSVWLYSMVCMQVEGDMVVMSWCVCLARCIWVGMS